MGCVDRVIGLPRARVLARLLGSVATLALTTTSLALADERRDTTQSKPSAAQSPARTAPQSTGSTDASSPDDVPWDEIDRVLKETDTTPSPTTGTIDTLRVAKNPQPGDIKPGDIAVETYDGPEDSADPDAFDDSDQGDSEAAPVKPTITAKPQITTPPAYTLPLSRYFDERAAILLADFDDQDRDAAKAFYAERRDEPLWIKNGALTDQARAVFNVFATANDWGLQSSDFKIDSVASADALETDEQSLVDADIKMTMTALKYARYARGGRITDPTKQLSSYLDRKPKLRDPATVLHALAQADDKAAAILALHPQHEQFKRLREKLLALRKGPEEEIITIPSGRLIKKGATHPHIALIRKRLKVASPGMKPDGTAADDSYYDNTLAEAVKRFKEERDISPVTTTITRTLRNALNDRNVLSEDLILANMEQWRWMPDDLGKLHIAVNIPEFSVRVIKSGQTIHTERVVTGRTTTQTPVFSRNLQTVVFQPVWNVPQSIMVNELLPGLRNGRNTIGGRGLVAKRNGRTVDPWSVDWYRTDIRNYHIYQPPGPSNALGVVKFLFPNKHAVYLHDTPSKSLFNSSSRAFSHGCIRVRDPVRLAEVIMEEDRQWDSQAVKKLLQSGPENNDVTLNAPIPVHITYFTAWVQDDGSVETYQDIYGHEKRIKQALAGEWSKIAVNLDHLIPVKPTPATRPSRRYTNYDDGWFGFDDGYGRPTSRRQRRNGYYAYGYDDDPRNSRRDRRRGRRPKQPNFFEQLFGN